MCPAQEPTLVKVLPSAMSLREMTSGRVQPARLFMLVPCSCPDPPGTRIPICWFWLFLRVPSPQISQKKSGCKKGGEAPSAFHASHRRHSPPLPQRAAAQRHRQRGQHSWCSQPQACLVCVGLGAARARLAGLAGASSSLDTRCAPQSSAAPAAASSSSRLAGTAVGCCAA